VRLADRLGRFAERKRVALGEPAPEQICRRCIDAWTSFGRHDDLTVLAVRRRAHPTEPLLMCAPATLRATRELRRVATEWLTDLGAGAGEVPALELAIGELTANVAQHAYPPDDVGDLWIRAELDRSGVLHVDIGDEGTWHAPEAAPRTGGRGLWLAGEMVDDLQVTQGDGKPGREGTIVRLQRRLRRECAPGPAATGRPECSADTVRLHRDPDGMTIFVFGPVDADTAPRFAELLNRATRGGVHPFTIDLSAVPTLSGAGVRVLFDLRDRLRGFGHRLSVQAVPGTSAHTVLELAGLSPGVPAGSE
jgi:anti-sigma regulatory factor (Ser/Thr protein kinase)/anti-anti-sigma regulatory factor